MAQCIRPKKIYVKSKTQGNKVVIAPCGHCPACCKTKVNEWVFRLTQEFEKAQYRSTCVTLTYDDAHVHTVYDPEHNRVWNTHDYSDMTKFFKELNRLQKNKLISAGVITKAEWKYRKELHIKYLYASEYGSEGDKKDVNGHIYIKKRGEYNNPHFHAAIVNIMLSDEEIAAVWDKGMIDFDSHHKYKFTPRAIRYVTKYIMKTRLRYHDDEHKRICNKKSKYQADPKIQACTGLGECYLTKEVIEFYRKHPKHTYITVREGYKIGIPRYYRKKLQQHGVWLFRYQPKEQSSITVPEKLYQEIIKRGISPKEAVNKVYEHDRFLVLQQLKV